MHPSGFVVLVFALSYAGADDICARNVGIEWKADADDCSVFYLCFNTKEYKYTCPVSYVRDFITKACVPKGSVEDTCKSFDLLYWSMKSLFTLILSHFHSAVYILVGLRLHRTLPIF